MVRNLPLLLILLLVCPGTHASQPVAGSSTRDLLYSTILRQNVVNMRATVSQGSKTPRILRITGSRDGRVHTVIEAVGSDQSREIFDDGDKVYIFSPSESRTEVMPSSRCSLAEASLRVNLAETNYDLDVTKGMFIAGRRAVLLSAVPHHKSLETRRMYLDADNRVLLRLILETGKDSKTVLDTVAISFPGALSLPTPPFAKGAYPITHYDRVEALDLRDATSKLLFTPIVPSSLPLGFVLNQAEVVPSASHKVLALRITDGLVKATVYQFKIADDDGKRHHRTFLDRDGLRIIVVGLLPDEAKQKILNSFKVSNLSREWDPGTFEDLITVTLK